ncbi:MAG: hypothetical protein M3Q22_03375 [Actinomycetota bacterium]|nr:hypothetical protein [Actinomycetota bacterium]
MTEQTPDGRDRSDQQRATTGGATRTHEAINRTLATIALVLSIVVLVALIVFGVRVNSAINNIGEGLSNLGGGLGETMEPGVETYGESAPGLNEDGTLYQQPDDADPGSYIGPLNPDGTACVGYGCTPEMDAELDGQGAFTDDDLERRCSEGAATVEECFGPGSDENGNGIADINE